MRVLRLSRAIVRRVTERRSDCDPRLPRTARRIVDSVQRDGDRALRRYAERWDGLGPRQALRVSESQLKSALSGISGQLRMALEVAARNIRTFCEWQLPREFRRESQPGLILGQLIRPIESVGCYVPGGRYPLPSSLLMTVIPAQVAGVRRIVVTSPRPAPEILAAAALLGVKEFFRMGGAQAIAAMAYGTHTVQRVAKIVGPGNAYVTTAKKMVAFDCAIDFPAGPTEVVILAHDGNPAFIAADLVAQAEHDPEALCILITASAALGRAVAIEVKRQARANAVAQQALQRRGMILVARSREEALEAANRIAPEHITVASEDIARIENAGSIFVGEYSPQALGDYASGPNHVLPTGGYARFRGGLSVLDLLKIITVQEASPAAIRHIAPVVETLARAEGLEAHAASVRARCAHA